MAVKGVFASDANIPGSRRGDFAAGILLTNPTGSAPMLALSSGMDSADAMDVIVTWFEENHISGRFQVASVNGDGDGVTIDVTDASSYIAGTILLNQGTAEYLLVSAVVGNQLTLVRAFAGTSATTITTSHFLQRIGTAHREASGRPTAVANLGFPRFNYTQIFRNAWDVSKTAAAIEFHTGKLVAKNQADAALFHAEDIERSVIWGKRHVGVAASQPFRMMDGINNQISTNVAAVGATTTWPQVSTLLQTVFEKNIKGKPNERIAFCGNGTLAILNQIALDWGNLEIQIGQTDFGLNVSKLISPFGNVALMTHPLMTENAVWTNELYIYHPGAIRTRWLRRTHLDNYDTDGSRAGVDADFGVFTSELCIEYRAELTGSISTGFTASLGPIQRTIVVT